MSTPQFLLYFTSLNLSNTEFVNSTILTLPSDNWGVMSDTVYSVPVENRGEISAIHCVCNRQVMTKGWLYNPVTTKPAHRRKKPQMMRETETVLYIRVQEGETEKGENISKVVNNLY